MIHNKNIEKENDIPCEEYQVLCGIEEEFLIISKKGTLEQAADDLMVEAAKILEDNTDLLDKMKVQISGLDAEPNPAQIEYVTLPLPPKQIEEAIHKGRKLLIDAADRLDAKILAQSMHPIQSDPHPIAGTHINISVQRKGSLMTPDLMRSVYNYFWNYLPELIAISANSPMYGGENNKILSNRNLRSTVLKRNGSANFEIPDSRPALIPMEYYGRRRYKLKIGSGKDEFSKKVIANRKGDRLMDITPRGPSTNIGDDKDDSPSRNRIEIRIFDIQPTTKHLLNIAHLCCASGLHAVALGKGQEEELEVDQYHKKNLKIAMRDGRNSVFQRANGKEQPLKDSLQTWIENVKVYQKPLEVSFEGLMDTMKSRKIQEDISIDYQTKNFEKLRQEGKTLVVVRFKEKRIVSDSRGNKYKVPKGAKIDGTLSSDYQLNFEEENGVVHQFKSIKIVNTLKVKGLQIPLKGGDKILNSMSRSDYMSRRLFGGFPFPF